MRCKEEEGEGEEETKKGKTSDRQVIRPLLGQADACEWVRDSETHRERGGKNERKKKREREIEKEEQNYKEEWEINVRQTAFV